MCGRYTLTISADELEKFFSARLDHSLYQRRYNIAPSQSCPILRTPSQFDFLDWGFVPKWAKDPKDAGWINARAETVHEKPAFRSSFKSKRCLVPATGFFEWQATGEGKVPHYIFLKSQEPFAIAGLWEAWTSSEGAVKETFALLTTQANAFMQPLHDRMPVIIDPPNWKRYLEGPFENIRDLLQGSSAPLDEYSVSKAVNSPKRDDADLIQKVLS